MPFPIENFNAPERAQQRQDNYDTHLAYLESIAPSLLACGAKPDDANIKASGGIYLVDVDMRDEALELIQNNPFHQAGLFERVEITRWRKAYLDGINHLGGQ